MIKQVIILRRDLNMGLGTSCSQVAHASQKVFFDRMNKPVFIQGMEQLNIKCNNFTDAMVDWMNGSFTKIVVGCNSEQELLDLQKQADDAEIVNAIILDNGNTEFKTKHCIICESDELEIFEDINRIKTKLPVKRYRCKDCGTEFEIKDVIRRNQPTYTALAIGPDYSEKIDKITKGLKLL